MGRSKGSHGGLSAGRFSGSFGRLVFYPLPPPTDAGAVLIAALVAAVIGVLILGPHVARLVG